MRFGPASVKDDRATESVSMTATTVPALPDSTRTPRTSTCAERMGGITDAAMIATPAAAARDELRRVEACVRFIMVPSSA